MATDSHRPDTARVDAVDSPVSCPGPGADRPEPVRVARIESYDDDPDECTIYPADATAADLTTTWITAREGSFTRLDDMR
ncbi:hypothetical protein GCM10008995_16410 [Halobellus salinus]|uniref:DUF7511 domain-containing protein n=1 Tax=Halobellus salinus TaxID=931585 RepID=A0A830ET55_9EURY|nr:hypothetical protein [Halobellus salinus]GGJ07268.1 hypothetical protein GCM10008995_16410 [Halobellus salinus]SMP25919.1 hypothetical protein SAMN06265347_11129 [Halobellus salinus]